MQALLGLGSNLGDRWSNLAGAVSGLREWDEELVVSPVYETEPVGGPDGQGPYLNCVARAEVAATPHAVLEFCLELEQRAGRVRIEHWGPRTLDIDVLFLDDLVIDTPELVVPHPRWAERAFVLVPLFDVAPDRVGERLEAVDTSGVRRVGELLSGVVAPPERAR